MRMHVLRCVYRFERSVLHLRSFYAVTHELLSTIPCIPSLMVQVHFIVRCQFLLSMFDVHTTHICAVGAFGYYIKIDKIHHQKNNKQQTVNGQNDALTNFRFYLLVLTLCRRQIVLSSNYYYWCDFYSQFDHETSNKLWSDTRARPPTLAISTNLANTKVHMGECERWRTTRWTKSLNKPNGKSKSSFWF